MTRRFAYEPVGDVPEDTPPTSVYLRIIEHAGPFWSESECQTPDFDELHAALGISRGLYDDIMAWHEQSRVPTAEHIEHGQVLTARLRDEVAGIEVLPLED